MLTTAELHRLVPHFNCGHPKVNQNLIVYGESAKGERLVRCRLCMLAHQEAYRRSKGIPARYAA